MLILHEPGIVDCCVGIVRSPAWVMSVRPLPTVSIRLHSIRGCIASHDLSVYKNELDRTASMPSACRFRVCLVIHAIQPSFMCLYEEHCALLEAIQTRADCDWKENRNYIAGKTAAEAIRHYSVLYSHPEFPIFCTALATMPAMGNGATINLWGDADPLVLPVFNLNFSQTRTPPSHRMGRCSYSHPLNRFAHRTHTVCEPVACVR